MGPGNEARVKGVVNEEAPLPCFIKEDLILMSKLTGCTSLWYHTGLDSILLGSTTSGCMTHALFPPTPDGHFTLSLPLLPCHVIAKPESQIISS